MDTHTHAPMTRDVANEISGEVGASILKTLTDLRAEAAELMHRIADIQAAWAEHDWTWLADTGVISQRSALTMLRIDLIDADLEDATSSDASAC